MSISTASQADFEFACAFEAGDVSPSAFNHLTHLRIAYVYLSRGDLNCAQQSLRGPLLAFLDANGILTIAKVTLSLVLFGPKVYGERRGLLIVPTKMAQALAPLLFGVIMAKYGPNTLRISATIGLIANVALLRLASVLAT